MLFDEIVFIVKYILIEGYDISTLPAELFAKL